jgi:hypothetical protein
MYQNKHDAWHYSPGANKAIIKAAAIPLNHIRLLSITSNLINPTDPLGAKRSMNNMVEILVVAFSVLSLLATLLIWTVLVASKRLDDDSQSMKYESLGHNRFFDSKTKPIRFH